MIFLQRKINIEGSCSSVGMKSIYDQKARVWSDTQPLVGHCEYNL